MNRAFAVVGLVVAVACISCVSPTSTAAGLNLESLFGGSAAAQPAKEQPLPPLPKPVGPPKVVAVSRFDNKAIQGHSIDLGLEKQLINALQKTGHFRVVDRTNIGDNIAEREFSGASGKMLGAQYLIEGTILSYEAGVSQSGTRLRCRGFGLDLRNSKCYLALDVSVKDAETAEFLASQRVEARQESGHGGIILDGSGGSVDAGATRRAPMERVVQLAIDKAVYFIVTELAKRGAASADICVAEVDEDGSVSLSGGRNCGLRPGMLCDVYRRGKDITDPQSGRVLGHRDKHIGKVRLAEVHEEFSVAEAVSGEGFVRGDVVKIAKGEEPCDTQLSQR